MMKQPSIKSWAIRHLNRAGGSLDIALLWSAGRRKNNVLLTSGISIALTIRSLGLRWSATIGRGMFLLTFHSSGVGSRDLEIAPTVKLQIRKERSKTMIDRKAAMRRIVTCAVEGAVFLLLFVQLFPFGLIYPDDSASGGGGAYAENAPVLFIFGVGAFFGLLPGIAWAID